MVSSNMLVSSCFSSLSVLSSFIGPLLVAYLASFTSLVQADETASSATSTACADIFNSECMFARLPTFDLVVSLTV